MKKIYIATKMIGEAYAEFIKDASPEVEQWLTHKLRHTFGVAHEIMNIFYDEKNVYEMFAPDERELVEMTGILHDLARFYQHKNGKIIPSSEFDHGKAAVNLIKDNPQVSDQKMLFAIHEHNKFAIDYHNPLYCQLEETEKKKAEVLAKLLRDADKLENIRFFSYYGVERLAVMPQGNLSEAIKQNIKNHQTVDYKNVKTAADSLAVSLSWINDIYFVSTMECLRKLHFIENCLDLIGQRGASAEDIDFLHKNMTYEM